MAPATDRRGALHQEDNFGMTDVRIGRLRPTYADPSNELVVYSGNEPCVLPTTSLELDVVKVTTTTAADHDQYQLGFLGLGGQTGTAGTKPSRFGIWTFGRLLASKTSLSWMMPLRKSR